MPIDIKAGTIMMRAGLSLPRGICFQSDPYCKNWEVLTNLDGYGVDRSVRAAGWNFFFAAATVNALTFGRREGKNARQAVDRILSRVEAQNFNCVEITEISTKHFLGIPYMSVCAHARQIQVGGTLQDNTERRQAQRLLDLSRN
jgi:hypothetical protein